jgi:hypothetical protein
MPTWGQVKKKKRRRKPISIDPMKELNKLIENKSLKRKQGSWAEYYE